MKYELHRFAVWSNVFYIAPLSIAWYFHLVLVSLALLFVILFSVAFHATDESEFIVSDWVAAAVLILFCIFLWYLGGFKPVFTALIVLLGLIALSIRYFFEHGKRGGVLHGFWHIASAAVATLCVLSYTLHI
jgi:hypothetical protein